MRVRCYEDGFDRFVDYCDDYPAAAAQKFAGNETGGVWSVDVVVTALDDEARALPGWMADEDDPQFKLYRVTPETTWNAREVRTFGAEVAGAAAPKATNRGDHG